MLRYDIKLNGDSFKRDKLVWSEKYLSPDLSFISGVTDPSYHLEMFNYLASSNSINNVDSTLSLETINVIREGYVVLSAKTFDVKEGSFVDYSKYDSGTTVNYEYVFINGKYFYKHDIGGGESGFTIDNLLNAVKTISDETGEEIEVVKEDIVVPESEIVDNQLLIDAVCWIEDGEVEIDGYKYFYDKNEIYGAGGSDVSGGVLKYWQDGSPLKKEEITDCEEIICKPYKSTSDYKEVTKFILTKEDSVEKDFEKLSFCEYYYFVKYKNNYCPVKKKYEGTTFKFVCEIPNYVLSATTVEGNLAPTEFDLYFLDEFSDIGMDTYKRKEAVEKGQIINSANASVHGIYDLNDLKNVPAFIKIDETFIDVEYNVMNSNKGIEVLVYLEDSYAPLDVDDKLVFVNRSVKDGFQCPVYDQKDYGATESEKFIIYNGKKYVLEKNLKDKVLINGNEYDIEYRYGKEEKTKCIVTIDDEEVPFYIKNITGGTYEEGQLQRYGLIVSGCPCGASATTGTYDIKPYSGVTICGESYIVRNYDYRLPAAGEEAPQVTYANLLLDDKSTLVVKRKLGSSAYICSPYVDEDSFTSEFKRYISGEICANIVTNQSFMVLYLENKIFGETLITEQLGFKGNDTPASTDDFYNLFKDLSLYINSGYIHIPLSFGMKTANNIMQDDIVTRDFYEAQKKLAINPIVDMEKDVYVPKYIVSNGGKYEGATTVFEPIKQININFHFRTRDLSSWKVKEGYDNTETSGDTENWFVTDYYPYKKILLDSGDTLQNTSDLMGLLYFTNDDIFYQKSRVAKSFARLSYYDSTDPQTQSLLATSSVFIDEHKLYKIFIDNSRKNVYDYGVVTEPEFKLNEDGFIEYSGDTTNKIDITVLSKTNKINVQTELLGFKKDKIDYQDKDNDCGNIVINESRRISSRMEIKSKYETDTSSEGFYMYIFREYSEDLHPKAVYMKVDFNHAGIGRTIPFIIPMHWVSDTTDPNKMYPERSLQLKDSTDLEELKKGIPLSYVYAQTYIPLYAVYDFINKEYAYVFDDRYVTVDENGVANINLFEIKVMNETEVTDKEIIDISKNDLVRGVINIRTTQFDKRQFKDEVE